MNGSPDRRGVVDVGGEVLWVPGEVFRDVEILFDLRLIKYRDRKFASSF